MMEGPGCHMEFVPHSPCPGEILSVPGWESINALSLSHESVFFYLKHNCSPQLDAD